MAKPDLGIKRLCAHCGARFYDLNHAPITCPKCGTVFEAVVASRGRPEAARAAVREVEAVTPETREAEFVSLEEADAEAQGKKKPAGAPAGADDEVEIDDESLDDAAFIEETEEEDADVTEIIGNDIENEEET
ncbi:MAG TPA: TIGR02300 family protein [Xanthobacteraceae bacterium]|nr:TIGR02300 family protein [Xanthobacteraceae bacterium]